MNQQHVLVASFVALALALLIILSLTIMSIPRSREVSRSGECTVNLKRIGLGLHNYHSSYKQMPPANGGTVGTTEALCNQGRLSGFAALLPFIEQQSAWDELSNRSLDSTFPSMGPVPSYDPSVYTLWSTQFDTFICPHESTPRESFGLRSYMFCYGDGVDTVGKSYYHKSREDPPTSTEIRNQRASCRGAFVPGQRIRFRDMLDGMSNTIMASETTVEVYPSSPRGSVARNIDGLAEQPSLALEIAKGSGFQSNVETWSVGKGSMWAEGSFVLNGFTTVLPPNSPSATIPGEPDSGIVSASSHHNDGVYVLMGDGAIRFVSDTIDTGNTSAPSVSYMNDNAGDKSPYGVWGAMGTRGSKEVIPSEREAEFRTVRSLR